MSNDQEVDEARYSVQFVAALPSPIEVTGWSRIACSQAGPLHMSEWVLVNGSIAAIDSAFAESGVQMKHFRAYKPTKDQWCVVDGALLSAAVDHGFTIQV
jgi:hypothetical protein